MTAEFESSVDSEGSKTNRYGTDWNEGLRAV